MSNWLVDFEFPKTIWHPKTVSTHPPELVGTKCSGGIVDHGLKGESGDEGTKITRRSKGLTIKMPKNKINWSGYKNPDGSINWEKLGFTEGIKPDRKEAFINAAQLMYDYINENDVIMRVGEVNFDVIIFAIIRKVIENSNSSLENPESFYAYCVEFVRKVLPHYENVMNKFKKERDDCPQQCIDIEAQVVHDLSQNVLEILNKEE